MHRSFPFQIKDNQLAKHALKLDEKQVKIRKSKFWNSALVGPIQSSLFPKLYDIDEKRRPTTENSQLNKFKEKKNNQNWSKIQLL
jgi:hypothetical protein